MTACAGVNRRDRHRVVGPLLPGDYRSAIARNGDMIIFSKRGRTDYLEIIVEHKPELSLAEIAESSLWLRAQIKNRIVDKRGS